MFYTYQAKQTSKKAFDNFSKKTSYQINDTRLNTILNDCSNYNELLNQFLKTRHRDLNTHANKIINEKKKKCQEFIYFRLSIALVTIFPALKTLIIASITEFSS